MATITYYAIALLADGRIGQLLVTVVPGSKSEQEWTGVTYDNARDAEEDLRRLNNCSGR